MINDLCEHARAYGGHVSGECDRKYGDASNDYGENAPKYGGCDHDNGDHYHKSGDRAHARCDSIDVIACMPRTFILVAGVFAW